MNARLVTYTHAETAVLHAAGARGMSQGTISYHCLHTNAILRHFNRHADFVTSLCMNPVNDTFLSSDRAGAFCLWDVRDPNAVAAGTTGARGLGVAAFDHTGAVFCVACPDRCAHLSRPRRWCCRSILLPPSRLLRSLHAVRCAAYGALHGDDPAADAMHGDALAAAG